jgi:hypothetical protein
MFGKKQEELCYENVKKHYPSINIERVTTGKRRRGPVFHFDGKL